MTYQVSRNGQLYGPYTLEDLQRYVAAGNVLATDLTKSEEMPEWVTVAQLLGTAAVPPSPAYSTPPAYPQQPGTAYPDPPNLNWGIEVLLAFLTCGIFVMVWNLVIASWANRVQPNSKALMYYIIATVLIVLNLGGSWGIVIAIAHHNPHPPSQSSRQSDRSRLLGHSSHRPLHSARHARATLQRFRTTRPPSQRRHDLLLRRLLLPVQAQRDQPDQTGPPLPEPRTMNLAGRNRIAAILRAAAPPAVITLAAAILLRFPPRRTASTPNAPSSNTFNCNVPAAASHARSPLCCADISSKQYTSTPSSRFCFPSSPLTASSATAVSCGAKRSAGLNHLRLLFTARWR